MNKRLNSGQRIGEIVAQFPKAADIFIEYEVDFCCGGDRILDVVLTEQQLNKDEIMDRLNQEYEAFNEGINAKVDWVQAPFTELIDHIEGTHHLFMRQTLPMVDQLINKILKVHYHHSGALLTKVHQLFNALKTDIELHLIKEEEVLFPVIKDFEKNPSKDQLQKVQTMLIETEDEHEGAGDILKELRRITNGYTVPEGGCQTFEITYQKLKDIEEDLFKHIHLENNILFWRLKMMK